MAEWLSCATTALLFHTLGWSSRYTKQIIFGIYVAYHSQTETSKALIYELACKGLQYALIGLVTLQAFRCLLTVASTTEWTGQGKVLLMPCKTTHPRPFTQKPHFGRSYLLVGIPVDWEGTSGGLVSSSSKRPSWPFSKTCCYNVDPADHLEQGEVNMGLRGKVDAYMKSQGVDPAAYPHAYLITSASLMGYHTDPISFWYLYSVDMSLAAMILEINDTFGERRMYFLMPTTAEEVNQIQSADAHRNAGSRRLNALAFMQEKPKGPCVSPFETREGLYSLMVIDPLEALFKGRNPIDSVIELNSSNGRGGIVGRLVSDGQPLAPLTMTIVQKTQFLLSWWWVDLVTLLSAILETGVLWFQINRHVWSRPAPLRISPGRNTDCAERTLEISFRMYLRSLVEQCQVPVALEYFPSGTADLGKELMLSSPAKGKQDGGVEEMELRVLTPAFYTRFVFYAHDLEAFFSELRESCTIWVSRPELLPKLLFRKPTAALEARGPMDYLYFEAIRYLRRRPERMTSRQPPDSPSGTVAMDIRDFRISPMDALVLKQDDAKMRKRYRSLVLRLFVAERFASGRLLLVDATLIILQTWLAWDIGFAWEGKTRFLALAAVVWAYGHG